MKQLRALIIEDSQGDTELQRIMHRHGGQVRGTGVPGRGATFYFTLSG